MTGHLLYGKYIFNKKENTWSPDKNERRALHDPYNRFIHVVFSLSRGKSLVFCDARKFGKVTLIPTDKLYDKKYGLEKLGPEPLDKNFSLNNFTKRILKKKNSNIKTVLMDQTIIAGIGNIYSDEILWASGVHPESKPLYIPKEKYRNMYENMQILLRKGIKFGGDSMSDYRNIDGKKGRFQNYHNIYQRKNEPCLKKNCRGIIKRRVINGRSAHLCDKHQSLYNKA